MIITQPMQRTSMFIMTLLLSITVYSICFSGCTLFTCLVLSSLTWSTSLLCSLDLSLGKKLLLYPSSWLATEPHYSGSRLWNKLRIHGEMQVCASRSAKITTSDPVWCPKFRQWFGGPRLKRGLWCCWALELSWKLSPGRLQSSIVLAWLHPH
jgi:hypothetical protein